MIAITAFLLIAAADPAVEIMAKAAANHESAAEARRSFVYQQKIRSSMVRSSGEVARREKREYQVIPNEKSTEKKLTAFAGEYRKGKQMIAYTEPGFKYKGVDLDGDLIRGLTEDLTNEKGSRDGIPHSLFPLETKDLDKYKFTMKDEETVDGRKAYRISFEPAKPENCVHIGSDEGNPCDASWKGDAWIDKEDLQPSRILTDLAFKIPFVIRAFLGTNLRQTGFSVHYERVAPGIWFPKTYGTEFRLDVLWGYKRTITLSLESTGFQRTETSSTIEYRIPEI